MSRLRIAIGLVASFVNVAFAFAQADEERQQIVRALVTAAGDDDRSVRQAAFATLGKTGVENMEVVAALQMGLKDADVDVRLAALAAYLKIVKNADEKSRVLVDLLDDKAEPRVDEFGDPAPSPAQVARKYLRQIGAPAVPHLVAALDDEQKHISALQVLKQIGPAASEAAPAVVVMLKSKDAVTRKKAVDALAALGGEADDVVGRLTEMLADDNAEVRQSVVTCLTKFGAKSKPAVPKLLELVGDSDPLVRKKAVVCLGAIATNSARPAGMSNELWNLTRRHFREMDADKDGQVKAAEARDYGIEIRQYDADDDRMITLEEFAAGVIKEENPPDATFSRFFDLFR